MPSVTRRWLLDDGAMLLGDNAASTRSAGSGIIRNNRHNRRRGVN